MFGKIKTIMGTLGWLLLGIVLMCNEIGPWWVGWVPLTVSAIALTVQMEGLLAKKEDWEI